MIINAHTDIPERWSSAISRKQNQFDENKMLKEIDRRIAAEESGKKFKKQHKKDKKDKDKKRDKKHKHKKEKVQQNSDFASLPVEYFDFTSDHGLIPALPSNNSYNRNLVISFSHSGVQFILN